MPIAAVERFEIAHVGRIGRAEGIVVDRPARRVFGVAVAVLFDQPVQEFEEMPRCSQITQGVFQIIIADRFVDETAQTRCVAGLAVGGGVRAAGSEAIARQVVKRRAGPAQRLDHVELVGSSPVVEFLVFLFEIVGQLDRQE